MPGYEPYLLCDFHVHTTWSDGRLTLRDVVDLYGQTGKFDVLAITDHILCKKDLLGRIGRIRARHNSHIVALGLKKFISADLKAREILEEIRRQDAVSIACHPHHRTTTRMEIGTCHLWDHRKELAGLVDVWEAANRDDLFSVTSLKHYPYVANSDFHKPKHLYSWKTLVKSAKTWPAVKAALKTNVDIAITLFRKEPC